MRDEDAARFNFASEFVKGRVAAIKGDMGALDAELAKIVSNDASTIDARPARATSSCARSAAAST